MYVRMMEANELQWMMEARQHLEVIQQKKLFDAQCLWRNSLENGLKFDQLNGFSKCPQH